MKMYRSFLALFGLLIVTGCASMASPQKLAAAHWRLIYENNADGDALTGSKQELVEAVRQGQPVRIVTVGRRIEHAADAGFLSVFEGEVFAQIEAIEAQRPTLNPTRMGYRDPGTKWRMIVGTNGMVTAQMDGQEPNARTGHTRWFVQGPQ